MRCESYTSLALFIENLLKGLRIHFGRGNLCLDPSEGGRVHSSHAMDSTDACGNTGSGCSPKCRPSGCAKMDSFCLKWGEIIGYKKHAKFDTLSLYTTQRLRGVWNVRNSGESGERNWRRRIGGQLAPCLDIRFLLARGAGSFPS